MKKKQIVNSVDKGHKKRRQLEGRKELVEVELQEKWAEQRSGEGKKKRDRKRERKEDWKWKTKRK